MPIFVLTKTNNIYIIMKTTNNNNTTQKVVKFIASTIVTVYGIATILGVGYILLNIDKVSFNF